MWQKMKKNKWKTLGVILLIAFVLSFLCGCAGMLETVGEKRAIGASGFSTGLVVGKVTDKIKDSITPDYKFRKPVITACMPYIPDGTFHSDEPENFVEEQPDEQMTVDDIMAKYSIRVHCVTAKCEVDCEWDVGWEEFSERQNGKFSLFSAKLLDFDDMIDGCKRQPDLCIDVLSQFSEDGDILINLVD